LHPHVSYDMSAWGRSGWTVIAVIAFIFLILTVRRRR
jgi:hypothetical protein